MESELDASASPSEVDSQSPLPHHLRLNDCLDRLPYRNGKKKCAVKVFTPYHESRHLLVFNVPKLNLFKELETFVLRFGLAISNHELSTVSATEDFSEVHHLTMASIRDAQLAKRRLDDANFYGAVLHVGYAPEMETIEQTKQKMTAREKRYEKGLAKVEREREDGFGGEVEEQSMGKNIDAKNDEKTKVTSQKEMNKSPCQSSKKHKLDAEPSGIVFHGDSETSTPMKKMKCDVTHPKLDVMKGFKSTMKPKIVFHMKR